MEKKVIAAGHICLDITPVFPDKEKKVKKLSDIMSPGKLIHMDAADVHTGGSVANTGLAMRFFGADVQLMGKVGDDAFGMMVKNILDQDGVGEYLVVAEGESTSYSVIIAVPGIDRILLHHPGANDTFLAGDISEEVLEKVALLHFGYPPIMKKMYENDGEELEVLMKKAKCHGTATSLDMTMVDPDSEAGRADWEKIIQRALPYVDFFLPSVEELCFMLDRSRLEEWQERAQGDDVTGILDVEKDIKPLADRCMKFGAKVLMIKCGTAGIYYRTASKEVLEQIGEKTELRLEEWAEKEGFERCYRPEKVRSGTGAGDTCIAAFLTAMLKGYSLEKCIQLAAGAGACCVETYDALSGLKTLEEIERKIENGWEKA